MTSLLTALEALSKSAAIEKPTLVNWVKDAIVNAGYTVYEIDDGRPWGAYIRMEGSDADRFVEEFFPGLSSQEARLGIENAELSPKILIVAPKQRLSWQYHDRRAERWMFLDDGAYYKSETDEPGEMKTISKGEVVQFARGERHRLVGLNDRYTLVAEIWQHSDPNNLSEEADIIRVSDDYRR